MNMDKRNKTFNLHVSQWLTVVRFFSVCCCLLLNSLSLTLSQTKADLQVWHSVLCFLSCCCSSLPNPSVVKCTRIYEWFICLVYILVFISWRSWVILSTRACSFLVLPLYPPHSRRNRDDFNLCRWKYYSSRISDARCCCCLRFIWSILTRSLSGRAASRILNRSHYMRELAEKVLLGCASKRKSTKLCPVSLRPEKGQKINPSQQMCNVFRFPS